MQFGVIGSGSWATALAKILTGNGKNIYWYIRNTDTINQLAQRRHNPHYLNSAFFNTDLLQLSSNMNYVIEKSDVLVIVIPSAYVHQSLSTLNKDVFAGKKIISAIKGILPEKNQLLNEYLADNFNVALAAYFTVLGPCHAEEVAAEKLSYLTFSGLDAAITKQLAGSFKTAFINTVVNTDILGVQYAAILKNIYALGAGIAHGLEYGDNFLSVYIANAASEMMRFLHEVKHEASGVQHNYAASVYLGDLLVTCYSLYSRNRMLGNMIGKGYSVKAAQLELGMVAEGYNASKCIHITNQSLQVNIPIADIVYKILWEQLQPAEGFAVIESLLV
ncbi:NAD(P)H-dependent glycerol-3-phosphate dehydrogenase [Parafilimonas sp.]|uniref:NAD(P)H-dependent glycerol-3-phosphate dehydrogenase n=1 Tax=Parafilimonas sp. TaxID=1969739 RepID=UPI0039E63164